MKLNSFEMINAPLRYTKWWLAIGIILIIGLVIASLIPLPKMITTLPHNSDKLEHFIAYFILMGWFVQIYRLPTQKLRLIAYFILLGLLLEVLQGLSGIRHADWTDVVANSLGVLLAWQAGKTRFSYLFSYIESNFINS
ncbi:MAG: hypothetical protein BWK79_07765 [Beggiatoa sp. IS2]|nr:MAG: hypothetical protein BWK79_07765 [Beggiatoa sp. IS2]